jgi:Tfp pilus assembly protein PilV
MWSYIMSSPGLMRVRGATLIEVMLAVALMAVTTLGLVAAQLWIAREARAAALREQAAFVADGVAEASRVAGGVGSGDAGVQQWKARAASLLPHGDASVTGRAAGISSARVTWTAVSNLPAAVEYIDKPESCGDATLPTGTACLAMAFVQ